VARVEFQPGLSPNQGWGAANTVLASEIACQSVRKARSTAVRGVQKDMRVYSNLCSGRLDVLFRSRISTSVTSLLGTGIVCCSRKVSKLTPTEVFAMGASSLTLLPAPSL
jgi:hypothetical protein